MQELVMKIVKAFQMNEAQEQELMGYPEGILNSVWESYKSGKVKKDNPGAWFIKVCGLRLRDRPELANPQNKFKKYSGKDTNSGGSTGPRPLVKILDPTPEPRTSQEIAELIFNTMQTPQMLALQDKDPWLYDFINKLGKAVFNRQLSREQILITQ